MRRRVYILIKEHKEAGTLSTETYEEIKDIEFQRMCDEWRDQLERPNSPGEWTKMALVPRLETWLSKKVGSMSYHLTQIMSGHGCFAKFIFRIG